jgi:integrase
LAQFRHRKLIETTVEDFFRVLEGGTISSNSYLRILQNLTVGLAWLPWPIIPKKLWPVAKFKIKRAITREEHQKIIAAEKNAERWLFYELLWEIEASQSDAVMLESKNIDWPERVLSYQRLKTGTWAYLAIGKRLESLLRQLLQQGPLFPGLAKTKDSDRASEFHRRCKLCGITGISLHSYRYAWAERAKAAGYPEHYAMEALVNPQ